MKRIISIFLAFVMTLLLVPCAPAMAENADKLYLNKTGTEITVNDTETLTAVLCENGEFCAADNITWESSDDNIATVSDGTITAVAEGNAVITAEYDGLIAECKVEVVSDNQKLYFEDEWIHLANIGTGSYVLKGTLAENATVSVGRGSKPYSASSTTGSDTLISQLGDGSFTATAAGITELIATAMDGDEEVTAKCYVTIKSSGTDANPSVHMNVQNIEKGSPFWKFGYMNSEDEFLEYDYVNPNNLGVCTTDKQFENGYIFLNGQKWAPGNENDSVMVWIAPKSGTVSVGRGTVYTHRIYQGSLNSGQTTDEKYAIKLQIIYNNDVKFEETYEAAKNEGTDVYPYRYEIDTSAIDSTQSLKNISVEKGDEIYFVAHTVEGSGNPYLQLNSSYFNVSYSSFAENTAVSFESKTKSAEIGKTITNEPNHNGTEVAYYSDDTDIAEVSADGSVTVKGEGECRIYAVVDGKAADYYTVVGTAAKKILMNYKTAEITEGETIDLRAAYFTDSTIGEDFYGQGSFTWESSDNTVATVTDGLVTAIGEGSTKITVTDGEKSASCTLFVNADSPITLSDTDAGIAANKTYTLTAYLAESHAGQEITWSSSDKTVAAVEGGVVTALGSGVATITASLADGSSAFCVVYCGEVNQEAYHDNSEVGMWKYYYAESGTMNLQEMTNYNESQKRYSKGSKSFIQSTIMSFDSSYDVFRSWKAPASGTVEISVNNTNRIYRESDVSAQEAAKGEFQLIANGSVLKSFVFELQEKEDGTYYSSTRYNGAGPSVDGTHYDRKESFQNDFGTVRVNVSKGEEIHFAWRRIEGTYAYLGTSSGGFKIKYTSNDALYGMPVENESLSLAAGEISNAAKAVLKGKGAIEEKITYYSDDNSVAEVSGEGAVKGIGTGTATVYAINSSGTLMDYVEITVSGGDFTVSAPVFNKETDGSVTVSIAAENNGTQERTVIMIAVTRDAQGRPVNVYKSTQTTVPADGQEKELSVSGVSCSGALKIDTYIWESDTAPKPIIDSVSKSISQIS